MNNIVQNQLAAVAALPVQQAPELDGERIIVIRTQTSEFVSEHVEHNSVLFSVVNGRQARIEGVPRAINPAERMIFEGMPVAKLITRRTPTVTMDLRDLDQDQADPAMAAFAGADRDGPRPSRDRALQYVCRFEGIAKTDESTIQLQRDSHKLIDIVANGVTKFVNTGSYRFTPLELVSFYAPWPEDATVVKQIGVNNNVRIAALVARPSFRVHEPARVLPTLGSTALEFDPNMTFFDVHGVNLCPHFVPRGTTGIFLELG